MAERIWRIWAERAVDMEIGAMGSVTLHGADVGDTTTIIETAERRGRAGRLLLEASVADRAVTGRDRQ